MGTTFLGRQEAGTRRWAVRHRPGAGLDWFRAHRGVVAAADAVLFTVITWAGTFVGGPNAHEVSMLYVLPIGLAAVTFGVPGGCVAATLASVAFATSMVQAGTAGPIGAVGW